MSDVFKASNGIELDEFGRFKYAHSEIRKTFLEDSVHEARKEFYELKGTQDPRNPIVG